MITEPKTIHESSLTSRELRALYAMESTVSLFRENEFCNNIVYTLLKESIEELKSVK